MATVVEKLHDLEYDELTTLMLIEKDLDLLDVFKTEINMPFSLLYKLQTEGKLNPQTKIMLEEIFEKLICTKQSLINLYIKLGGFEPIQPKEIEEDIPEEELEVVVIQEVEKAEYKNPTSEFVKDAEKPVKVKGVVSQVKTKPKAKTEVEKPKKEIPRRFGKVQILADIQAKGGKPNLCHTALLKLNDLKNVMVVLNNKGIKDLHVEESLLTDEDYKEIIGTIKLLERRLKPITSKKV